VWIRYRDPGFLEVGKGRQAGQDILVTYSDPTPVAGIHYFGFAQLEGSPATVSDIDVTPKFGVDLGESKIVQAGSLPVSGSSYGVALTGHYALVGDIQEGIALLDITNPAHPAKVASFPQSTANLTVSGDRAYAGSLGQFLVLDLSQLPGSLPTLGSCPIGATNQNAGRPAISGNFAYIPNGPHGLQIIDLSTPASPRVAATIPAGSPVEGLSAVWIGQPYAYVASDLLGIKIYDISDPANPRMIGSYNKPNGYIQANAITVAGDFAYLTSATGALYVLNVADVTKPSLVTEFHAGKNFFDVAVHGSIAYVSGHGFGVMALDVSDPAHPARIATASAEQALPEHWSMVVAGNFAYVASKGLVVYSIELKP
jgi:hypothetical protein